MDKQGFVMFLDRGLGDAQLSNTDYQNIKAEFDRLCDEQEKIDNTGFGKVFECINETLLEGKPHPTLYPYTDDEQVIRKALELTGNTNDEAFCERFMRHYSLFVEGKALQAKGLELLAKNYPQKEKQVEGWRFVPMAIVGDQELIKVVDDIMMRDAQQGKGLFSNMSDIEEESEDEDALLMVKAYNCEASLIRYWNELEKFGVIGKGKNDGFFKYEYRVILLRILNGLATFISTNTDKPAKIKNHIANTIKEFDMMPIWGIFFQILTLQGLCRWLEIVNINEGDNGYYEVQSLYDWLCERLANKEVSFCYVPYGDGDRQRLKPLCSYLYSTELGKMVQSAIFKKQPQQVNSGKTTGALNLPSELDTERARKYFAKAIEAKYIKVTDNGMQWMFGGERGNKVRLGYFIQKVFCPNNTERIPEKAINKLFGVDRIGSAISQIASAKKPQKWRKEIDDLF